MPRSLLGATSALMLGLGLLGGMLLGVAPAGAGPPDEPSVVEMNGSQERGQARRRAGHAGRPGQGHPPHGGVRLCPAGRLRRSARAEAGHPQGRRGRGWPHLHPPPAPGAPLVRWRTVHQRGFPLLVGGRRQQRPAQPDRAARRAVRRRRGAQGRVPGPPDRALQLGKAQPVLPAGARRRDAHLHLYAGPLPQAVPRKVRRPRRAGGQGGGGAGARLGTAARPQGWHVQLRQPGPADLAALAPDHAGAGDPVRVRSQRILPPGRPERPAAALHRSGRARCGRRQADPGQDRRRRDRSAVTRPVLQALHLPQGEPGAQPSRYLLVGDGAGGTCRHLSQSQRQ